jgi:hypothetical protein
MPDKIEYAAADMAVRNIRGPDPEAVVAAWCASLGRQKDGAAMSDKALRSLIGKTKWAAQSISKQIARLARVIDVMLDDAKA